MIEDYNFVPAVARNQAFSRDLSWRTNDKTTRAEGREGRQSRQQRPQNIAVVVSWCGVEGETTR